MDFKNEFITAEVGTDSVNFTCRIQLTELEAMISHWIIWWKDNNKIADNDIVLINSAKYSVRGLSSAATVEYIQILQVNNIKETDYGEYVCTLVLNRPNMTSTSSDSILIISNFIFQPVCSISPSESETGQQQMTLFCTSLPGDPPIVLYWKDNEGNITAIKQQQQNEPVILSYTVSVESLSSNPRFICTAKSTVSTDTKECVIGNLTSMTMMTSGEVTSMASSSIAQSIEESTATRYETSPQCKCVSCDKDNNTAIAILSVIGAISILANMAFSSYILIKKGKKKNKNEKDSNYYATSISQQHSKQQHGVEIFKQEAGEDGYMEPIEVGEDGYMEPPVHIPDPYEQININVEYDF
ncbi:cell surface glycoprotein MUC18-like isoform X2 [Anneissia japonica]|uniref:cell surface glycoprotein MUC18-like isoform X2 n=1 Tax=Anneissia japonica TaxID=1529436 RepID=UPI0014255406|nr:cell surface glycoprotein MUC18-like isoform X2 [Anneissia japonica]